jgi:ABC-2 type transport system ATP-binding protein
MMPSNTSDSAFGLRVGLAPQRLGIYPQLTVRQNLTSTAMLHGYSKRQSLKATDEVIEMLGLADQCTVRAEHLSGGQQRRLHTGMALVHHPSVLFLDEATVGADVEARADILATVKRLASEGTAVVYTTHYLEEVESLQADVAFLVEGSIADHGSLQSMIAAHATPSIQVTFACDRQPLANGWIAVNGHLEPQQPINEAGRALAELLGQPSTAGLQLKDVEVIHADINNAYLNVVGTAAKKVQA